VTRSQPLGGKAQFGGQRFARWKCGVEPTARRTRSEMLTSSSDDVEGASDHEAIVKGETSSSPARRSRSRSREGAPEPGARCRAGDEDGKKLLEMGEGFPKESTNADG